MVRGMGQRAPSVPVAELVSATGDVRIDGAPARPGAAIALGARIDAGGDARACISFDHGLARSCLDSNTTLSVEKSDPEERLLSLMKGTVVSALEKLPPGHHFVVASHGASATVTGTIFSVTSTEGSGVVVRVHEGSVKTEAPAVSRAVTRDQELEVSRDVVGTVDVAVRDHELELVGIQIARAVPPVPEEKPKLGGVAPVKPPSETSVPTEPMVKPATASEMLQTARKLRAQGNSSGAAEAYRKLMTTHPKSREANAALLSLAGLELGALGDPNGALRSYDAYLRSGGGLSQEARYGRIQALRRLGRAAEEQAAVKQFIEAYPNSVQARALKSRLENE